jgi:hypothetical protein
MNRAMSPCQNTHWSSVGISVTLTPVRLRAVDVLPKVRIGIVGKFSYTQASSAPQATTAKYSVNSLIEFTGSPMRHSIRSVPLSISSTALLSCA